MNKTNIKTIQNTEENQNIIKKLHSHRLIRKMIELALLIAVVSAGVAHAQASSITEDNILQQINTQRDLRGLKPLLKNEQLNQAAENKANDMIKRDYFEHYAYGLTPWTFIAEQDYNYLYAGENLAMDFQTSEGMVRAWMSSATHRKNILSQDYDDIGIGVVKGEFTDSKGTHETIMVTNMFGKEKPKILQLFDNVFNTVKSWF